MTRKTNKVLEIASKPGESVDQATARSMLKPSVQAAAATQEWLHTDSAPDMMSLTQELTRQAEATQSGDLSRAEEMLTAQAHTLDAIFNRLATRAINAEYLPQFEANLKLALRAQSQARATWETLSTIQNPPVARYINQANIAHGHQQVNNSSSRADENEKAPNQLLEQTDGNRLDCGATVAASGTDPQMATVGEIDRTEDGGG